MAVALTASAQTTRDVRMPISVCLQYQRARQQRGTKVAPFRQYGFRRLMPPKKYNDKQLWGYQVRLDTVPSGVDGAIGEEVRVGKGAVALYRYLRRMNIYSFAVVDDADGNGKCQYIFWAKGYYRRYASELRAMGFTMSQDSRRPNVLRFSRPDTSVYVDFIIWEDIYVMEIGVS